MQDRGLDDFVASTDEEIAAIAAFFHEDARRPAASYRTKRILKRKRM
jgi:hypothetical protein